ncbi:MAG: DNA-binding protein [Bacteroides sp.]|nr:DNA-binding protein [Bacteroides sp.]MCM1380239.1 DNA-binding protein [Bacteroides sp.]MCM1446566.1 DNA-binding protein [Prevotella sp.]
MIETRPTCDPEGVFSVKRTCAELGVCHKTLRKLRSLGLIEPVNPGNRARLKYTGRSIIDCWDKASRL